MIRRISSGGVYEARIGYSRAVVCDGLVHVSGTVAAGPDVPEGVVEQCRSALTVIGAALAQAGSGFSDVLRVTYIFPDPGDFEPCWPLLREAFGDHPPAATMLSARLIDPKFRIEIEVTARVPPATRADRTT